MHSLPPSPITSNSNSSSIGTDDQDMKDFAMDASDDQGIDVKFRAKKRNRQNLSHMSMEEKMNRRKMKNRVAAQSARDRKKAKMDEMEGKLSHIDDEKKRLAKEHERLRKRNLELEQENLELKRRLCNTQDVRPKPTNAAKSNATASVVTEEPKDNSVSLESAVLINDSQQQKQGHLKSLEALKSRQRPAKDAVKLEEQEAFPWMMPFVCWLVAIENLMRSSSGSKSALMNFLKDNSSKMPSELVESILRFTKTSEQENHLFSNTFSSHNLLSSCPKLMRSLKPSSLFGT